MTLGHHGCRDHVVLERRFPKGVARGQIEGAQPVPARARIGHHHAVPRHRGLGEQRVAEPALPHRPSVEGIHDLQRAALRIEGHEPPDADDGRRTVVPRPELPPQVTRVPLERVDLVAAEAAAEVHPPVHDGGGGNAPAGSHPESPPAKARPLIQEWFSLARVSVPPTRSRHAPSP